MASSSKEGIPKEIQDQFCTITGATSDVAVRLLEACGGNLEMAIGMHMDGAEGAAGGAGPTDGTGARPQPGSSQSQASQGAQHDDIRAPIPQKQEVLVEDNRTNFGNIGRYGRRRQVRSVFDGFRDFEAETRQQELDLASGQPKSARQKRLEDLFRPPLDLMFKGSFHAARDAGVSSNRWLMVNVQNVKEFQCQILNRDVWSNPSVKPLVKEHFIFWQVYNDSEEGKKYMQFYKVYHWPYIAVLDPRTGENMVNWNNVDAMSFCELVTTYLAEHNQPDGPSPTAEPPRKKNKVENITDATEDAQLEAALKASVVETKTKEPVLVSSDEEFDSDVELETFSDSGDEANPKSSHEKAPTESKSKEKDSDTKSEPEVSIMKDSEADDTNDGVSPPRSPQHDTTPSTSTSTQGPDKNTLINTTNNDHPNTHQTSSSSSISSSLSSSDSSSASQHSEPAVDKESSVNSEKNSSGTVPDSGVDELASSSSSTSSKNGETSQKQNKFQFVAQSAPLPAPELTSWKDFIGSKDDPESVLNIRFPNGKRQQFKVPCTSKLRALVLFVQEEGYHKEMYELVTNFPKRRLSYLDFEDTLKNHGLFPQETVFVQER